MTKQKLTQLRVQLYKATPLKLQLVEELNNTLKHCFNSNIETTTIGFKPKFLTLNDNMDVRMIEIDPQEIGNVLIHWYPKFDVSTTSDPFCAAYILTPNEIRKIIKTLQKVKDTYQNINKT